MRACPSCCNNNRNNKRKKKKKERNWPRARRPNGMEKIFPDKHKRGKKKRNKTNKQTKGDPITQTRHVSLHLSSERERLNKKTPRLHHIILKNRTEEIIKNKKEGGLSLVCLLCRNVRHPSAFGPQKRFRFVVLLFLFFYLNVIDILTSYLYSIFSKLIHSNDVIDILVRVCGRFVLVYNILGSASKRKFEG